MELSTQATKYENFSKATKADAADLREHLRLVDTKVQNGYRIWIYLYAQNSSALCIYESELIWNCYPYVRYLNVCFIANNNRTDFALFDASADVEASQL